MASVLHKFVSSRLIEPSRRMPRAQVARHKAARL